MRVFITGSADGLGLMAGRLLAGQGHSVVLHARNQLRARDAKASLPQAEAVVMGDVSTIAAMVSVAEQVNALGDFDAVIHNAAIGYQEQKKVVTADGLPELFAVNSLAPYVLTALIRRPARLIYLSSGLHKEGDESLGDLVWERRRWIPEDPGLFESQRILAPALETGPVPRSKCRRLVKKEQLRIQARRHHHPSPPLERQDTGDPRLQFKRPHDLAVFVMK